MTGKGFCCISLTLAARLIGVFDLITSTMAINLLAEEYFYNEKRLIVFQDFKIFIGLSWADTWTERKSENTLDNTWFRACLMVYSTFYFLCSIDLILATIFRNKNHTLPWLTLEIINLANRTGDAILRFFQPQCESYQSYQRAANFPLASFYLLLGVYFWIIVLTAQNSWPGEVSTSSDNFSEPNEQASHAINMNSPRLKSTLTDENQTSFESPKLPVSSKYHPL